MDRFEIEILRDKLSKKQKDLLKKYQHMFEEIKQVDEYGDEFWSARDLRKVLDYGSWRKFHKIIEEAKIACGSFSEQAEDHFVLVDQMIKTGKGAKRKVVDYHLTFYACGLIVQSADRRKPIVAAAQSYFVIETGVLRVLKRDKDLAIAWVEERHKTKIGHKSVSELTETASYRGGGNKYAWVHLEGGRGLFGGFSTDQVGKRHGLIGGERYWDYAATDVLEMRKWQETSTSKRVIREKVDSAEAIARIHREEGVAVREFVIQRGLGSPEDIQLDAQKLVKLEEKRNKHS